MLDFTVCVHTQQMSAPPPVVPRKHSGVRVMPTPGEQPPPGGLPIYKDSGKGIFIQYVFICLNMCSYKYTFSFSASVFPAAWN